MLHDQGLPLHLWVEACNTAVYLHNRSPHHILGMKTLEEDFSGKRPDVAHFRIFESSTDAEQPHAEVSQVETSSQAESSRDGRKRTREADKLLKDARENVGEPYSQRRQRRSPETYTEYMSVVGECVETKPSSFEEAVSQPIWVDAMVQEYDSIVRNSVWDVVLRLEKKSIVSSHWLYKVKQAIDGSVEKHKA
eukprot:PITA_30482